MYLMFTNSDPIYAEAHVKIHGFDIVLGPLYYSTSSFAGNLLIDL
jgi:hypothetical protein